MGMRQLHNHGIVHRDLKSLNVLVSTPYAEFPKDINTDAFHVQVFDFECPGGILDTGLLKSFKNRRGDGLTMYH